MTANSIRQSNRRNTFWLASVVALIIALFGLAAIMTSQAAPSVAARAAEPLVSPTPCEGNYTWQHVPSPNVGSDHNNLRGIGVVSTNDVWAVGFTDPSQDTLIQHWNGAQWTVVPSPNVGTYSNKLYGIAVIAANDIWAVGSYYDTAIFKTRPLTLHYDGSTWTVVPVNIDFGVDYIDLMSVSAASSNEVIAVGRRSYNTQSPLTLHWDGTQWREELSGRIPGCPGSSYVCSFYAVTSVGPNDAWAVGAIHDNGPATLTAHWNGTSWTRVASPNPSQSTTYLGAITNAGPDNVWAAGFFLDYSTGRYATLTIRWNGTAWVVVPSPNPSFNIGKGGSNSKRPREQQDSPDGSGYYPPSSPAGNMLLGISAAAPDEIWAVGSSDQVGDSETNTLIMRWNGSQWTVVPSPNPSGFAGYNRLYAVGVAGRDDAWASGSYWNGANSYVSLIERYNGNSCPTPTPLTPTATPTACTGNPAWNIIPSANGPSANNQLKTVGVVSANDIWALGTHYNGLIGGLIEHWDGNTWTIVPNSIRSSGFEDIAVISANDIWAVGNGGGNPDGAVTAHWDGTSWTRVGLSEFGPDDSLYGVAAVASNNVWAVGYNYYGVLILHWNGTSWSRTGFDIEAPRSDLNEPSVPSDYLTRLTDVDVVSPSDIWAVGTIRVSGSNRTLIMHYDGTSWNFVSSPNPGTYSNVLESVTVVSANDIWAVGYYANGYTNTPSQSLALHWNGTNWTQVTTPSPGFSPGPGGSPDNNSEYIGTFLYDVTAVSANEVWAVGKYSPNGFSSGETVILRWNGTAWTRVTSPNPANYNELRGVAAIASNYVWAVGQRGPVNNSNTLTLRYGPPCNATPLPTNTPRPPTNTPILPTITTGTIVSTNTRTPQSTSTAAASFTAIATPTCGPMWQRVNSPNNQNANYTVLNGITVISPQDIWAVGYNRMSLWESLIMHWNGTQWSIVPSPTNANIELKAVDAISANDIWAVGYDLTTGYTQPLTMHYNGAQWSVVPAPGTGNTHSSLNGVGAVSANDVWAVGEGPSGPMTMHWNGTQWSVTPNPFSGANNYTPGKDGRPGSYNNTLNAVGVVATNDVWAVGTRNGVTWTIRWNGTQWNHVSSPNVTNEDSLNAITVIAPNDIWAVGHSNFYLDPRGAIALHWNGSQWSNVPTLPGNFGLFGVTHESPNEVWTVGWEDTGQYASDALIMKWDGAHWTRIPSPNPSYANRDELFAAAAAGPDDVWAVGMFDYDSLIDRYYNAPCSTPGPTNTARPTNTPAPPTNTAGPPTSTSPPGVTNTVVPPTSTSATATAIATGTPCAGTTITGALTLDDPTQAGRLNTLTQASTCSDPRDCPGVLETVPRHFDAYTFRNISNSEACFTVNVTAACLNSILIQSAAYLGSFNPSNLCLNYLADVGPGVLTNSQYSFRVPAGQTFVVVVNELAPNLLCPNYTLSVSGPACPVAGTPVPTSTSIIPTVTVPATIPATVTVPPIPTTGACSMVFSDVSTSNAFYQQIMCLSCMGMVGGYPDGTFRPNSEVTRGQLSKIVSNTAGFGDAPTQQTFADVPEGSTFYMYIERMAQRGVLSGYPCGSTGEPCGQGNKPYFRPFSNATRGQISKVVANAANLTDEPNGQTFEDVSTSHTFYQWVQRLAQHGMMSGYACGGQGEPCGTGSRPYFRPAANATRGQVSKIVGNGFYPDCEMRRSR